MRKGDVVGGAFIRKDDGLLPKRVMFGASECGLKQGRGDQDKECTIVAESFVTSSQTGDTHHDTQMNGLR